jgi:hypothetical protein
VSKALGIKQLDDRRNRRYRHHDQMRQSIPMDADQELKGWKKKDRLGKGNISNLKERYRRSRCECELLFL